MVCLVVRGGSRLSLEENGVARVPEVLVSWVVNLVGLVVLSRECKLSTDVCSLPKLLLNVSVP